jgi:hypothetical protein
VRYPMSDKPHSHTVGENTASGEDACLCLSIGHVVTPETPRLEGWPISEEATA